MWPINGRPKKTDIGKKESNVLLISVSVLPCVWDTAWQDFKSCLYKNSNVKIESYIQNKENKWILKWIWEMNAKPCTEKQRAKDKTCIHPSVTLPPSWSQQEKKKPNKTNNRCLSAHTATLSRGCEWRTLPWETPHPSLLNDRMTKINF